MGGSVCWLLFLLIFDVILFCHVAGFIIIIIIIIIHRLRIVLGLQKNLTWCRKATYILSLNSVSPLAPYIGVVQLLKLTNQHWYIIIN